MKKFENFINKNFELYKKVYDVINSEYNIDEMINYLIENYSNVKDHSGRNILMIAIGYDSLYLVKKIIKSNKINIFDTDKSNNNLLFYCISENMLLYLLDKKLDYLHLNNKNENLLIRYTNIDLIKHIINLPNIDKIINDSKYGYTALYDAVLNLNYKKAKILLENGADPNIPSKSDNYSVLQSNLNISIKCVKLLLKYNIDINHQNDYNYTILSDMITIKPPKYDLIKILLENGANPNIIDNSKISIIEKLINNVKNIKIVNMFFKYSKYKLKINKKIFLKIISFSHIVIDYIKLFLKYDFNILKTKFDNNATVLHILAHRKELDGLKLLLDTNKFDWFEKDNNSKIFLDYLEPYKNEDSVLNFFNYIKKFKTEYEKYQRFKNLNKFNI